MATKHPIEYALQPRTVPDIGVYALTLRLRNIGEQALSEADVKLESLDTGCVRILGREAPLSRMEPGQEQRLDFQASIQATGEVYATLEGDLDGERLRWETPNLRIQVGGQPAELVSFLALNEPRARVGDPITCEATIRGLATSTSLVLEFWAEMPSGEFRSLAKEGIGRLAEGEQAHFTTEIAPREQGLYVLHAYLYHGAQGIGHRVEYLSIAL
jgi:hypothetical protein